MRNLRIACIGASGTGKTTLASFISGKYNLEMNPVGSRSVSKAMGFDSPYDVDKAGKRAEFQLRLLLEKWAWEGKQTSFVTDRTTLDNLTYTMFHDVYAIDPAFLDVVKTGLLRYTHIIYCPVEVFCKVGDDPNRVKDQIYHQLYDTTIRALLVKFHPSSVKLHTLSTANLEARQASVQQFIEAQ